MKDGFRVYDTDTHINPAAEVLDKYVDPDFRAAAAGTGGRTARRSASGRGPSDLHNYRFGTKYYRRILGEEAPREEIYRPGFQVDGQQEAAPGHPGRPGSKIACWTWTMKAPTSHFLIPTSWLSLVGVDDASIEVAMIRAYHRHMAEFCAPYPDRLKSPIVASARRARRGRARNPPMGQSAKWAVAVMPLLAEGLPADHPSLEPIWREAQEYDLPIANHSFTWTPPYYPGYRDLYDNIFLGRLAAHPWGAMRFVAAFIGGGVFDRYPRLRMGVLECGFGWLPFWARRMDEQAIYVGGTAPLKMKPSEYMMSGRFFCSIEHHEGEDMFTSLTGFLGDGVLMYASDYPHSECQFPNSVANILAWSSVARNGSASCCGRTRAGSSVRRSCKESRPHAVQLHRRAGGVPLGAAPVPGGEVAADRGAAADGNRGRVGTRELARAQPAARSHRACTSPRRMAARASASSNSASCWRRWAAPCCARRISPRPCWPRPRS